MLFEAMRNAASLPRSAEEKGVDKGSTEKDDCKPWHKKRKYETLKQEIQDDFAACYDDISEHSDLAYVKRR